MAFFSGIVAYTRGTISRTTTFINSFLPVKAEAPHGVFDNDLLTSLFASFNILDAEVTRDKQVASHPLETNIYRQDNVVRMPVTAVVTVAAEANQLASLYDLLGQMYDDPNALFAVKVDGRFYQNMVMKTLPVRRDPSKFDVVEIPISFQEFIFSLAKVSAMSDPENVGLAQYSDRQKQGLQRGSTISGAEAINREASRTIPAGGS